jgi:hypothetical protein
VDAAASFFFVILALQAVMTAAVILLVGRRFPKRLRVYRFVAPAALPLLLFAMVAFAAVTGGDASGPNLARIFLAYAVLWLFGVIFATMLIRWTQRR